MDPGPSCPIVVRQPPDAGLIALTPRSATMPISLCARAVINCLALEISQKPLGFAIVPPRLIQERDRMHEHLFAALFASLWVPVSKSILLARVGVTLVEVRLRSSISDATPQSERDSLCRPSPTGIVTLEHRQCRYTWLKVAKLFMPLHQKSTGRQKLRPPNCWAAASQM